MAAFDQLDIEIRAIRPDDRLTGLKLGEAKFTPLKAFLQQNAASYERQSLSRTYGAFNAAESNRIAGYITLVCGEVVIDDGDAALIAGDDFKYRYRQYPAVKIARLAVDQRVRNRRLGDALVKLAIGIAREDVAPNVGCRFLMVDSKTEAVHFYERLGFTLLDTPANKARGEPVMFLDLGKL